MYVLKLDQKYISVKFFMIRFKILILFLSLFLFTNVNADVVKNYYQW